MSSPLHENLRAAGQGLICGSLVATPICFGVVYFGLAGLLVSGLMTGAGLITIANILKRRSLKPGAAKEGAVHA